MKKMQVFVGGHEEGENFVAFHQGYECSISTLEIK